jgi:hypothetical protein
MARILIGSSYMYRFYEAGKFPTAQQYKMINCKSLEVFKARMDDLREENKKIVISVIENFVCDGVKGVTDDKVANGLCEKAIKEYLKTVFECAKRLPGSKFALAQPILRPGNVWYSDKYEDLCKFHTEGINTMGSTTNIMKLEPMTRMSQKFEYDGVHLTPDCGAIFVQTTLEKAEAFFKAELVNLEEKMEVSEVNEDKAEGAQVEENLLQLNRRKPELGKRMLKLERKVQNMDSDIEMRRFQDSLVSAKMRDELDAIANTNKEDRIIITGMTAKTVMPQNFEEKNG